MLTVERLKHLLRYDPLAGTWCCNVSVGNRKQGKPAGYVCTTGYRRMKVDGRTYKTTRLAWLYMTGKWPAAEVDHADRDLTNECWDNLRLATRSENQANTRRYASNSSGFKGVGWNSGDQKWSARIQVGKRRVFLGNFDVAEQAAVAYDAAAKANFGQFAHTNF